MVLVFGLSASLLDCGTDMNFAWSAEADCGGVAKCNVQRFDLDQLSTPCGMFGYKMVERTTYAIISFPGFFLAFSTLRGLFAFLINRFWGKNIPGRVLRLSRVFAHMLEVSLFLLLFLGNRWSETFLRLLQSSSSASMASKPFSSDMRRNLKMFPRWERSA